MSTTPPDETTRTSGMPGATTGSTEGTAGTARGRDRATDYPLGLFGDARMPVPGNAEFLFYVASLLVAAIVAWGADDFGTGVWFDFFKWVTVAYLLSRGIAKASRVLEH